MHAEKIHEKHTNNRLIAEFMGSRIVSEEEIFNNIYPDRIFKKYEWSIPSGTPMIHWDNFKEGRFFYHSSWDWLMPVIRKINNMGKEFQFAIFKTYVSCTVEKGGKFYKDFSFSHAEYITEEQSDIEAAFNLVLAFVKWHNEREASAS